jgi:hypothetical protein
MAAHIGIHILMHCYAHYVVVHRASAILGQGMIRCVQRSYGDGAVTTTLGECEADVEMAEMQVVAS